MQLDFQDLDLVRRIADIRFTLTPRGLAQLFEKNQYASVVRQQSELKLLLAHLEGQLLNRCLRAAGMEHVTDPEREQVPLPRRVYDHIERFLAPDPVLMAECAERRRVLDAQAAGRNARPTTATARALEIPEMHK